jgi:hypothetical protein
MDLPYERNRPNAFEWTDKAFDLLDEGRLHGRVDRLAELEVATVVGVCPRCEHTFRFESSRHAVGTGGRTLESDDSTIDPNEFVPVEVRCQCKSDHDGRHDSEKGCGILFRIEVRPDQHHD